MRQLKGKVKESRKEKRERKQENVENKNKVFSIVVPTLLGVLTIIVGYIYYSSRPKV